MEEGIRVTGEMARPGKWLVEFFPLLRFVPAWAPGAGFKRKAAWAKARLSGIQHVPFKWAKEQIVRYHLAIVYTSLRSDFVSCFPGIGRLYRVIHVDGPSS
jgi:hypothetical protein